MSMTMGEIKHMAVTEHELRRIADALENIVKCLDGIGRTKVYNKPSIYDELKEKGASE